MMYRLLKIALIFSTLSLSASSQTLTPPVLTATANRNETLNESKQLHLPANITPAKADILFAMDLTGSMGGALSSVKTNSIDIMNKIRALIPETRFGVVSHMDYKNLYSGSTGDYPYKLNQPLTNDPGAVSSAINGLTLGDGGDGPEDYVRVFYETYSDSSIAWRDGAKRIVLFWADNMPHDPDPGRDSTMGTSDDLILDTVLSKMAATNTVLISFHYGSYNASWDNMAKKTGGSSFPGYSIPSDIATFIANKISETVKQIDTLKLETCTPGYENWIQSVTPPYIANVILDRDRDYNFNLTFHVPSDATPGIHNFKVCANGDGAEYASQQVTITVPGGLNNPPVANAGPDQTLYAGIDCSVSASLDGSGSIDPEGKPITYSWIISPGVTVTGMKPSVVLPSGISKIQLTVTDDKGASDIDTVIITVQDTLPPVPENTSLDTIKSQCSVTLSKPIANDNCDGIITATTDSLYFSTQGVHTVTWTYKDKYGNSFIQIQKVIIDDTIPPVPVQTTLPDLKGNCSFTYTDAPPEASDNCGDRITATTKDPLTRKGNGAWNITWIFDDKRGNTTSQTQRIIISDTIAPVPIIDTLPELKGSCEVIYSGDYPKAIDECGDTITAITLDSLTYREQGSWDIKWIYKDASGNSSTQLQHVTVLDKTPPELIKLDTLRGECSVILPTPYAYDSCSGRIPGITDSPDTIYGSGIHYILWTFKDENGNGVTQKQVVILKDITPPVITVPADTTIIIRAADSTCTIKIDSASAIDNCSIVTLKANRSDSRPFNSLFGRGNTKITWIATDGNGNTDTAVQIITVINNSIPKLTVPADTFMAEKEIMNLSVFASDSDGTIPSINVLSIPAWLTISDHNNDTASITLSPGCSDHGNNTIRVFATDSIDTAFATFKVRIDDVNFAPVFDPLPFSGIKIKEGIHYELTVKVQDCDGTDPSIRMLTSIPGAVFIDNKNSTGGFSWTPDADDYGFYMIIFEASDEAAQVRDTIIIEVTDQNVSPPVLFVSTNDTTCSVNLPLVIVVSATDSDGIPPFLKATQLPSDAKFTSDGNGNGIFSWTPQDTGTTVISITAYDQFDSTSVYKQITIRVNNKNITGPEFEPHPAVTIEQNQNLLLTVKAVDPDGTDPVLNLINSPSASYFMDNGDGTGTISWKPECDESGSFIFKASATDGKFHDTITIPVTVRDINCTPILYRITDINAQFGERISIPIRAYDPDNNGSVPVLSTYCLLPGYSFITKPDGSAIFSWTVEYQTGSFPVTFYATDGNSTDSMTLAISINKEGTLKISVKPKNARIYAFPSGCYQGKYLGTDSVKYTGAPGTCWFELQAPGCRSQRVAYNIKADSTINVACTLKPSIPLMVVSPDTLKWGASNQISQGGSISFADLNGDHIIDLSLATPSGISGYYGIDSARNTSYSSIPATYYSGDLQSCIHHSFIHWNNNHELSCIVSTKTGNVLKINLKNSSIDTLITKNGSKLYPTVFDVNKDDKKDIIVNVAGSGLFVYYNSGSDSNPVIDYAKECTSPSGSSLSDLNGAPLLLDLDNDNKEEIIIFSEGILKVFKADSQFSKLTFKENLSCGGKRIAADTLSNSIMGSTTGMSRLAIRTGNQILIFSTHLEGDITKDGKVDIRDISKISKNWEITEDKEFWDPEVNLKLSDTGYEIIDIRDITRASKNWESDE